MTKAPSKMHMYDMVKIDTIVFKIVYPPPPPMDRIRLGDTLQKIKLIDLQCEMYETVYTCIYY